MFSIIDRPTNIRSKLFKALIEKQSYSINGVVNITSVQFYVTPILNAMIRVGGTEDKDLLFRASFSILFLTIFLIQLVSSLKKLSTDSLNLGMAISSGIVLLTTGLFLLISILYILKNKRIIRVIRDQGRCVSSVEMLFDTQVISCEDVQ